MNENLESQYDQVVSYVEGYRAFIRKVSNRLIPVLIRSPRKYVLFVSQTPKVLKQLNPLSGKNLELNRSVIAEYATDAEKQLDYFQVAISEYPTDELSNAMSKAFTGFDFAKLKKIHDSRKAKLAQFSIKQFAGIGLAASTLVLKSIPKKVAERVFKTTYDQFEEYVFWITLIVTGYFLLFLLPNWYKYYKARITHEYVGNVLEYAAIKNPEGLRKAKAPSIQFVD